jgi:hypothetical protein
MNVFNYVQLIYPDFFLYFALHLYQDIVIYIWVTEFLILILVNMYNDDL